MTPDQYCQDKAVGSGSSFYYSFLFLSPQRRRAILALYALCRELDDLVDDCREPAVARDKLHWWRDEIDRMFAGRPNHPVTRALDPVVKEYGLAREHFAELIDGMQMDLDHQGYRDFRELGLYCYRAAGVVGLLTIEIFGYRNRDTRRYATELGAALQLTNILRDVREDARRGRVYIPSELLQAHGVSRRELIEGPTSDRAREAFRTLAERTREHYRRAEALLPEEDRPSQLSGLIMGAIYAALLDKIEARGYAVLEQRIGMTPLRKLWIAWHTARREQRRNARAHAR